MPDTFIPLSEVEWVEQLVCDRYKVKIPKFLASAHLWWGDWEKERFRSMEENLKRGNVLFDVGSEIGWQSAIYAQFVGPENMVLIEPCPELWPHIKATWKANGHENPRSTVIGFLSDKIYDPQNGFKGEHRGWIPQANREKILANTKFYHIDENSEDIGQSSLDWLVDISGVIPSAITIDVEGAELKVLQGARRILEDQKPLVWLSLHEGFVNRPGVDPKNDDVHALMASLGYAGEKLGVDHEEHWLFRPR